MCQSKVIAGRFSLDKNFILATIIHQYNLQCIKYKREGRREFFKSQYKKVWGVQPESKEQFKLFSCIELVVFNLPRKTTMFTPPELPKQDNLLRQCSQYITFNNRDGRLIAEWKDDLRLKSNIELYKSRNPVFAFLCSQADAKEKLVGFLLGIVLKNEPVKEEWEPQNRQEKALQHLTSWCEASCYTAAKKVWQRNQYLAWEDYLYVAKAFTYNRQKFRDILAKFDAAKASFNTYITEILIRAIQDEVAGEAKFSRWRLLDHESDKVLIVVLEREGKQEFEISRLLLARKHFKKVYQMNNIQNPMRKSGEKWPAPAVSDFQEAAMFYNAEKRLPAALHEIAIGPEITAEVLQEWMEVCIRALQNYPSQSISPRFCISIDFEGENKGKIELEDPQSTLEVFEMGEEDGSLSEQTELVLKQQLFLLKDEQIELLFLYYGMGWVQEKIGEWIGIHQTAVLNRLKTINKKLLKTLASLSKPEWVTSYVGGWLEKDYNKPVNSDIIHAALVKAIAKINLEDREVLRLRFAEKLEVSKVAFQLGISEDDVLKKIRESQVHLEKMLFKEIEKVSKDYLKLWLQKLLKLIVEEAYAKLEIVDVDKTDAEIVNLVLKECLEILKKQK